MRRAIVLSVYPVVMLLAASAAADSPKLKGAYGFTGLVPALLRRAALASRPALQDLTPPPCDRWTPRSLSPVRLPSKEFGRSMEMAPGPSRVRPLASPFVRPQDRRP
jgi:hypothetical protein